MLSAALALLVATSLGSAGSLTPPPGPPVPTMKTLAEIEPRIAVNNVNTPPDANALFNITQPGSYYLAGNVAGVTGKMGIEISTDSVTLDLMGFQLAGIPGSLDGIHVTSELFSPRKGVTILNGVIRNWGWAGVNLDIATGGRLYNLIALGNGGAGLEAGPESTIEACTAGENGQLGFFVGSSSVVTGCSSHGNTSSGFQISDGVIISNSTAVGNLEHGIYAFNGRTTITGCTILGNTINGIRDSEGSVIVNNSVGLNGKDGIEVTSSSLVLGNVCHRNGTTTPDGAGIHAVTVVGSGQNRIEGNNLTGNDLGLNVDSTGNLVIKNSARGNATAYDVVAGNDVGPIGTASTSTSPWANISF